MEALKRKIEEKGLKQRWIAKKMGISFEVLNRWLNDKSQIPPSREDELKALLK
jgi:transcriptional regulator with XRE-family HTH domain